MNKDSKALLNRDQICAYLNIKKEKFYKLVDDGMPVKKRGGSWTGHKQEIDDWFLVNKETPIPSF